MYIFKEKKQLEKQLLKMRLQQKRIGYVPTMGALHDGHIALLKQAKKESDIVLCTLFINPTQFNDNQDFEKYPVQTDADIQKLLEADVNILFLPEIKEVYPHGLTHLEHYDFGKLETVAEGAHRPGHFQGVGQVLSRFLKIIRPDKMFMGEKDYQQLLITRKLVGLIDQKVEVVSVNTCREPDGLAMSSRNARLSAEARKTAPALYQALQFVRKNIDHIPLDQLREEAIQMLSQKGFKVDYLLVADAASLRPVEDITPHASLILLTAAWLDGVRLIDNLLLNKS